jgi:hypothetical protein
LLDFIWVLKSGTRETVCVLWGRREIRSGFWWGNLRGKEHLEDIGIDVKMDLEAACVRAQTGFILPRIGGSGRLL